MRKINRIAILKILKKACYDSGSQKAWAEKHNISTAYVCDVLKGHRDIGEKILDALGYIEEKTYTKE